MPVDTSMYSNLQPINPMQNLATMAGTANALQQTQLLKNQNIQSGIDTQEMQAVRPLLSDTKQYTDEKGNVDFNKLIPVVMGAAPKNGAAIIKSIAEAQQQKIGMQNALMTQSSDALQRSSNAIASLDPHKVTVEELGQTRDAINSNFNNPQAVSANNQLFDMAINVAKNTKPGDPKRAEGLKQFAMMYQPIKTQQEINTPVAAQIGNGQQNALINLKPTLGGTPQYGIIPGSQQRVELSPNTQTMGPNNTPSYVGPQGPAGSLSSGESGSVPAGLPAGATTNIEDNFKQMNTHYAGLQSAAEALPLMQSLKGNILTLAKKAATGTGQDKKAYVDGFLQAVHIPGTGDLKTDTDLLKKYLAQFKLHGNAASSENTDAFNSLVDIANPGVEMSPDAIPEAVNQVISNVEAKASMRNHLSGYKFGNNGQGNATAYQAERQNLEQTADPRIWQWLDLKPGTPEAAKFMKKQPDAAALLKKVTQLEKMGVIKE